MMPIDQRCPMCSQSGAEPAGVVDGYRFLSCPHCELTYTPQPRAETETVYRERSGDPGTGVPPTGWADVSFLRPARPHLPEDRALRVLDFGCGRSTVPDQLRAEGHTVIGVDIYPPAQPHPHRLTGDLLELGLEHRQFDLAYSFQVFEHLPEPRPLFEELLRLTRPAGLLFIHTDMEMPEREAGLEQWWYVMPPQHCTLYRHRTFETVLADRPHRIIDRGPKYVLIQVGDGQDD